MKLSLIAALALSLLTAACGEELAPPRQDPAPLPSAEPAPAPAPRKLVEGNALPTAPTNLLADPGFALAGREAGYGSFLAFYDETFEQVELETTFDSRSPAGFGGNVALVKPTGATNKTSSPVMLLASFQGGAGPFRAQVWISKSEVAGAPADVTNDDKGITATITEESPDGEAYDLRPVDGSARVAGGRTWVLLRAEVQKPLAYGGFIVIRTGSGGGHFHIAAPEVVAQPLVDAHAIRSSKLLAAARAKTSAERGAITRYKQQRPRLIPASSKPRALF
ncbi:MAG: hypothetical protein KF819_13000 [Labilithrix sp.]|nr:hypothetical protein [Labilithrix sp.]